MPTTTLTITHADGDTTTADAFVGDLWTVAIGQPATIQFYFDQNPPNDQALVVPTTTSETISDAQTRQYAIVDGDLTVSDTGSLTVEDSGAYALRRYVDAAEGVEIRRGADHTVTYRETIPRYVDVQSLALKVEPATDLTDRGAVGIWGVVTGGRDARNAALTRDVVELELVVLARATEYDTHTDLETDLKVT